MEIKEILEVLGITEEVMPNNDKFYASISMISNNLNDALSFKSRLAEYGVVLNTYRFLKEYTRNKDEQQVVIDRLEELKKVNYQLVGDEFDVLFDEAKWDVFIAMQRDALVKKGFNQDTLKEDVTVGLNDQTYEKYLELENMANLVLQTIGESMNDEIANNLTKLISGNSGYNDEQIVLSALIYGQNRTDEDITRITNALIDLLEAKKGDVISR